MRNTVRMRVRKITNPDILFQGKEPSVWKFWEYGVSPTALQLFLNCRHQFYLRYVQGWQSRKSRLGMEFGNCCHYINELAYALRKPPSLKQVVEWIKQYEKEWSKQHKGCTRSAMETQELVYGYTEAVMPTYFLRYRGDFKGLSYPHEHKTPIPAKWLGLESKFKIPYKFPDGKTTWIHGRRDGVFETLRYNTYVFDTKCLSQINEGDILSSLTQNLQQMIYVYATAVELKKIPNGMVLNVVRRPGHRRGVDESLKDFFQRIEKEVLNPNKYDHYFMRLLGEVTAEEIRQWKLKQLDPMMVELRGWWEGTIPHFINPDQLTNKYGRCESFEVITAGDYSNCYRSKVPIFDEF